jgi:hypothetical protein
MPSSRRPPDNTSRAAASFARIAGWRRSFSNMSVPTRGSDVAEASGRRHRERTIARVEMLADEHGGVAEAFGPLSQFGAGAR